MFTANTSAIRRLAQYAARCMNRGFQSMSRHGTPMAVLCSRLLYRFCQHWHSVSRWIFGSSKNVFVTSRASCVPNSNPLCVLLSCFKFPLRVTRICEPSHNLFLSPLAWCLIITESGLIAVPCSSLLGCGSFVSCLARPTLIDFKSCRHSLC